MTDTSRLSGHDEFRRDKLVLDEAFNRRQGNKAEIKSLAATMIRHILINHFRGAETGTEWTLLVCLA